MKRGAIRISVTYIVIIIIATASLVFATTFFFQQKGELETLTGIVEQQVRQQTMRELAQTTSKVVLPVFSAELKHGKTYTFGLGIKNHLGYKDEFTARISFDSAVDTQTGAEVVPNIDTGRFFMPVLGPYELDDKERRVVAVPVRVPEGAAKGVTYIFDVKVSCGTDNALCKPHYGYPHQIEIEVI